jgi:feruloyl esterase
LIAVPALADNCTDLTKLTPPDASITAATMETGSFESPMDGLGNTTKVATAFCRVTGVAKSEPSSSIGFEVWLPASDKWNGRMLASGNLGHSGAANYPALNDALNRLLREARQPRLLLGLLARRRHRARHGAALPG